MNLTLTTRDLDHLEMLTGRVSVLTLGQAAGSEDRCGGFGGSPVRAGSNGTAFQSTHSYPWGDRCSNGVRDKDPDSDRISRQARERWSLAARPLTLCVASKRTAALLGSTACGLPQRDHLDHDLRLAAVYVHYRLHHPRLAQMWIGEHILPKAGFRIKDPDAFLREPNGTIRRVIESAGRYGAAQVQSFHDHCAEQKLPYELW